MSTLRPRALLLALGMLGCIAAALLRRQITWYIAGAVLVAAARLVAARGSWTPSGSLGIANTVTGLRLALISALPFAWHRLPRLAWIAVVLLLLALDLLDGWLARSRGECSAFGATFDMETDALAVMVLCFLLWEHGLAGPWVLIAGLWRYVYAALIAIVPGLAEVPRAAFYRWVFGILVICLTGAFLPVSHLPTVLAAVGTSLVSVSFLHALWRSTTLMKSSAASDQLRDRGRAA